MCKPNVSVRRRQCQPTPHGPVTSATLRGGEVVSAPHGWAWIKRPTAHRDGRPGWTGALLLIDRTVYDAEASFAAGEDQQPWLIVDLRQPENDTHYRLCIGPEATCDCPHATYRNLPCKHLVAVQAALDWLDAREQEEWLDGLEDPAADPFVQVMSQMQANIAAMDDLIAEEMNHQ